MRSTAARIRQAVIFELIALAIVSPAGALIFGHGPGDFGLLAILSSLIATLWAYLYNLGFDHALLRLRGRPDKTLPLRILHAVLFEGMLVVMLVPVAAWALSVGWVEALLVDLSLSGFFLVYAFAFYWVYDRISPPPPMHQAQDPAA